MGIENKGKETQKPRWPVGLLIAATLLVSMVIGAYILYDREFARDHSFMLQS